MKFKRDTESKYSLPATTPSSANVDQDDQRKRKTKLYFLATCLIFANASYAVAQGSPANSASVHEHAAPANLVQLVREATKRFVDVNTATAEGYAPFLGCISGSDHGAMGIHYVNGALLDGKIDASRPQALIYEPVDGKMRLVGVEFIVFSAAWLKKNATPPVLEGQTFLLVDSPNRYGIPAFFELHVWAWRDNPQGAFVDWNNDVTCEGD